MYSDCIFVHCGISCRLFAETEGEKVATGIGISCVRDWKGEADFEKMRENKRLRLVGGGSRSPEKPGPQIVLRAHPKKNCGIIVYYGRAKTLYFKMESE